MVEIVESACYGWGGGGVPDGDGAPDEPVPKVGVVPFGLVAPVGLDAPGVWPSEPAPTDPAPAFSPAAAFSRSIRGSYRNSHVA